MLLIKNIVPFIFLLKARKYCKYWRLLICLSVLVEVRLQKRLLRSLEQPSLYLNSSVKNRQQGNLFDGSLKPYKLIHLHRRRTVPYIRYCQQAYR